ncbi:MAG: HEPN domain-containing protein [Bacteroidales bacterium]
MKPEQVEYIKNWLFRAKEDIAVLESLASINLEYYASTICFHAQQAVEKYLKAFLAYNDINFPRTHDVDYLLLECQKIDKKAFIIDLKSLSDFGVSLRYPDDFYIPGIFETKEYIEIAKDIQKIVEEKIKL